MRIDANPSTTTGLERSNSSVTAPKGGASDMVKPTGPSAVDVAHLSTGTDAVQTLKAALDNVPDVRQQRVESLQQAIRNGSFQVSPGAIADAMLTRG